MTYTHGDRRNAFVTVRLKWELCFVCLCAEPPPVKPVVNPFAIERPHAAPHLLERQGSFRGFSQLNQSSPFKRQMSLRIGDLPSTVERQQNSLSTEAPGYKSNLTNGQPGKGILLGRSSGLHLCYRISMSLLPSVEVSWRSRFFFLFRCSSFFLVRRKCLQRLTVLTSFAFDMDIVVMELSSLETSLI